MPRIVVAVIVSLLAGFAVGAWLGSDDQEVPAATSSGPALLGSEASVEERIANLEQIIVQEREARIALEDTLAALFDDLEQLEAADERAASARESAERETRNTTQTRRGNRNDADWLTRYQQRRVDRLVEGGFTEEEARRTLRLESEVGFEVLQTSWESQRTGERTDPLSNAMDTHSILRERLGDAAFERYLEAQGQPTTIGVSQVYPGSPGGDAGIRPGDRLVSYDGERIYTMSELRRETMQGEPGERVVLEVERDGMRIQLSVPRGPIGVTGSGARVRGMNWWGS
ncbi:MAG: PDZ domain-containing protein [Woeseiaceae bacterium]|nr:PDZ domain-containing protein [Woeseiaceae bacterium]